MAWSLIMSIAFCGVFSHEDAPGLDFEVYITGSLKRTRWRLFDKNALANLLAALLRFWPFASIVLNLFSQTVLIQVLNLLHCRITGASVGLDSSLTPQFEESLWTTSKQINITAVSICIKKQEIFLPSSIGSESRVRSSALVPSSKSTLTT